MKPGEDNTKKNPDHHKDRAEKHRRMLPVRIGLCLMGLHIIGSLPFILGFLEPSICGGGPGAIYVLLESPYIELWQITGANQIDMVLSLEWNNIIFCLIGILVWFGYGWILGICLVGVRRIYFLAKRQRGKRSDAKPDPGTGLGVRGRP